MWLAIISLWLLHCLPAFLFPGCLCCESCSICSDNFDRSDGTDIDTGSACGWTEVSGAWDITSNQLRCTSAGVAISTTAHPDGDVTQFVSVDFKHDTTNSTCDVVINYVNSSNYFYVRYKTAGASGTIDIRRNNGGTHSSLSSVTATINTNTSYSATVCVSQVGSNKLIAAKLDNVHKVSATNSSIAGTSAGLGSSGGGTATFDNFVFQKSYNSTNADACNVCSVTCPHCDPTAIAAEGKVVLAGLTDSAGCACSNSNGTWYLPFFSIVASSCIYIYAAGWLCSGTNVFLRLRFTDGGSNYTTDVVLSYDPFGEFIMWVKDHGSSIPECVFSDVDIPYDHKFACGAGSTSATATVTVLAV